MYREIGEGSFLWELKDTWAREEVNKTDNGKEAKKKQWKASTQLEMKAEHLELCPAVDKLQPRISSSYVKV